MKPLPRTPASHMGDGPCVFQQLYFQCSNLPSHLGKAPEDGPSAQAPATLMGNLKEAPGSDLAQP